MRNVEGVRQIGVVESTLRDPDRAPKQGHEGAPDAWLRLEPAVAEGLSHVRVGDRMLVLAWLHHADRSALSVHPRDDETRPLTGVFSTRSASRPNPIGIHAVTVLAVDGPDVRVAGLEAVDGTPVLDLKPDVEYPQAARP